MARVSWLHLDIALSGAEVGDEVDLDRSVAHHLGTVLRAAIGTALVVADGRGGHAPAVLVAPDRVRLTAEVSHQPRARPRLHLVQALAKGRKLDEVVRVATELGVDAITPIATQRSSVRLEGERSERARDRWRAVARAACEQAGRAWHPEVAAVTRLGPQLPAVLQSAEEAGPSRVVLVAVPGAPALTDRLPPLADAGEVVIAIGPEGGFAPDEQRRLVATGALPVGLGPMVLRTEHAGAAALAVLAAGLGRWSHPESRGDGTRVPVSDAG